MMPFTNFVDMINADLYSLENIPGDLFDIHFKSYNKYVNFLNVSRFLNFSGYVIFATFHTNTLCIWKLSLKITSF